MCRWRIPSLMEHDLGSGSWRVRQASTVDTRSAQANGPKGSKTHRLMTRGFAVLLEHLRISTHQKENPCHPGIIMEVKNGPMIIFLYKQVLHDSSRECKILSSPIFSLASDHPDSPEKGQSREGGGHGFSRGYNTASSQSHLVTLGSISASDPPLEY